MRTQREDIMRCAPFSAHLHPVLMVRVAIRQMHTTARGTLLLRNMRSAQTETTKVVSYR